MGLFGNRFNKIKRSDVVDAICDLEKQQKEILESINNHQKEVEDLMIKGRRERDRNMQLYMAKRITLLKKENANNTKRLQFVLSNISAMNQLKTALDDREFIKTNSKMPLNKMLNNPAELKSFLSKISNKKMAQEERLAENLSTFDEVEQEYIENETLYGSDTETDNILAMFEMGQQLDDEAGEGFETVEEDNDKKVDPSDPIEA